MNPPTLEYLPATGDRDAGVASIPRRRRRSPGVAWVTAAWAGPGLLLWGHALLPGGMMAMLLGIAVLAFAFVRVAFWEWSYRPRLLQAGYAAPAVPGRLGLALFTLTAFALHLTLTAGTVVSTLSRPAWVPAADFWYDGRPYNAPVPKVLVLGPYILLNPRVEPRGIQGTVPGGRNIFIRCDANGRYSLN